MVRYFGLHRPYITDPEGDFALEAWEHMTFGGLGVEPSPDLCYHHANRMFGYWWGVYTVTVRLGQPETFVRVDGQRVPATPIEIAGDWKLRGM